MDFNTVSLEQALEVLGESFYLEGKSFEVVAIGGASLLLLGLLTRSTKDLDLLAYFENGELIPADKISTQFFQKAKEVGRALNLGENWLNAGPSSLLDLGLPQGFETRLTAKRYRGLTLYCAGRFDQICFKLYASVDQGPQSKHYADLKILKPSIFELNQAKRWCITHDVSQTFAEDIEKAIQGLENKDG